MIKELYNSYYSLHEVLVHRIKQLFCFISPIEILTALTNKKSRNSQDFFSKIKSKTFVPRPRLFPQEQDFYFMFLRHLGLEDYDTAIHSFLFAWIWPAVTL